MANAIQWEAVMESHAEVLNTTLDGLGIGATSPVGSAFNNGTALQTFFWAEIGHGTETEDAHAGDTLELRAVRAFDGTNYEKSDGMLVAVVEIEDVSADALHIYMTKMFQLPPCVMKFTLKNAGTHAMLDDDNYVELFSSNKEIQ